MVSSPINLLHQIALAGDRHQSPTARFSLLLCFVWCRPPSRKQDGARLIGRSLGEKKKCLIDPLSPLTATTSPRTVPSRGGMTIPRDMDRSEMLRECQCREGHLHPHTYPGSIYRPNGIHHLQTPRGYFGGATSCSLVLSPSPRPGTASQPPHSTPPEDPKTMPPTHSVTGV